MKIDLFGRRIFITVVNKKDLPHKDICPFCGSTRFRYKKRSGINQKCICLDCGKISYKWGRY